MDKLLYNITSHLIQGHQIDVFYTQLTIDQLWDNTFLSGLRNNQRTNQAINLVVDPIKP